MYVSSLHDGTFLFVSEILEQLLGYATGTLQSAVRATALYDGQDDKKRRAWVAKLKATTSAGEKFLCDPGFVKYIDGWLIPVFDIACLVTLATETEETAEYAIGVLVDRRTEVQTRRTLQTLLDILNHEWFDLGVHQLNKDGQLAWINRRGAELLQTDKGDPNQILSWVNSRGRSPGSVSSDAMDELISKTSWPQDDLLTLDDKREAIRMQLSLNGKSCGGDEIHGSPHGALLSAYDEANFTETKQRINEKLRTGEHLTVKHHRTFIIPPTLPINNRESAKRIAVNIHDHPVRSSDGPNLPQLFSLLTVVREESIPESVRKRLLQTGARNPLFEHAEVYTSIKLKRKVAIELITDASARGRTLKPWETIAHGNEDELVVTWVNTLFEQRLLAQGRITGSNDYFGKTDPELYPERDVGIEFKDVDANVLKLKYGETDERIEHHPISDQSQRMANPNGPWQTASVQVIKTPIYRDGSAVGVQVFFWMADARHVLGRLSELFQPWKLLDDVDVPAATKDQDGRFTYANIAFCEDNGRRIDEIIGYTDEDLFPEQIAKLYRDDDEMVRHEEKKIFKSEPHPTPTNPNQHVNVVKMPVRIGDETSRLGIYFLYWKAASGTAAVPGAVAPVLEILWREKEIRFLGISYPLRSFEWGPLRLIQELSYAYPKPVNRDFLMNDLGMKLGQFEKVVSRARGVLRIIGTNGNFRPQISNMDRNSNTYSLELTPVK